MPIDLDLYRREVRVAIKPDVRLSVVDIAPDFYKNTFLFLHGFGGNAMQWQYQLDTLSHTQRVIAPDLRGHGLSDKPHSDYSLSEILADLEAILDVFGITSRIILVGHSFGSALAAEFSITRPKRVEKLILIAAATRYKINPLYRTLLKFPEKSLDLVAPFVRKQLWAPPYVLKSMHTRSVSDWDGPQRYPLVSVPTLVIRGHMDRVFEKPQFEEVPRLITQIEDIDVGASGHMVMLERSEATNRAITRFLGEEKSSWSQSGLSREDPSKGLLVKERPWLPYYDEGVPDTISIPRATLPDLLGATARRFASKTAVLYEGRKLSYRTLYHSANRFAQGLRQAGVQKGDRVLIWLPNLPQTVIAFYGTLKSGAVVVHPTPEVSAEELAMRLHDSGARLMVVDQARLSIAIKAAEIRLQEGSWLKIIVAEPEEYLPLPGRLRTWFLRIGKKQSPVPPSPQLDIQTFQAFLHSQSKESPEGEISPKELALIQYTGGGDSPTLGVMLSHRNLLANVLQTRHWMPEAVEGEEKFLCLVPIIHSYGLTVAMNLPIALGASLIIPAKSETRDILQTIQRFQPTVFPGVPQIFLALIDIPEVRMYFGSIKLCISGSSPLPIEVLEAFEKITKSKLIEGYGLTEASPVTHLNPLSGSRKVGSIGLPIPSTEARLVDLRTGRRTMPVGQIGELAVRGPQVMQGYWNNPDATQRALSPDGWLLTGDVAQMDNEGYFRIIARKTDMWYPSRPDAPAFPRDVEEVLYEIPQIKEAAVVIVAGQPFAFVISKKERPTADSVIAYCKRRLPPELVPRLVIFSDEFPRGLLGRVLRRELANRLEESHKNPGDISPKPGYPSV